ncbi:LOW QUALITY PROTEIN: uridine diphosphate glucose pyrophosphatase NUDT14 [Ornithorhynchus anatinus]|uniref:LOW QUALITY PROTEIN: uridine diphosphate glucose pyrophosphatase NUDT14 n=1 Tax=Ornithorhynchus anatinus TaxID=9258 RepID=UPI0010A7A0CA|nr:LOW QUALITY PROTEIN: uridine diphosphate glucose pyrophosphatase NUDT14 [Ornithorhynchus anatinus]
MEQVEGLTVARCGASPFLRPYTLRYRQNGTQKAWDFMRTHDSVAVLIFNSTQQSFVLVKQFRPAVYMAELGRRCPEAFPDGGPDDTRDLGVAGVTLPSTAGVTYELWAGILDKPRPVLEEVACAEILEECGYQVPASDLRRITSYKSGVGVTGSTQTMFYAEVTDAMKVSEGGGRPEEGELIEVVNVPLRESRAFAYDERFSKTMGVVFGFTWFHSTFPPPAPSPPAPAQI